MHSLLLRWILPLISGVLCMLLVPPHDLGGLVWFCLLPLLVSLRLLRGRRVGWKGFGLGWLAGLISFLGSLHWVTEVTSVGWVALSCYLAIFFGLWSAFAAVLLKPAVQESESTTDESAVEKKIREKERQAAVPESHWKASGRSLLVAFSLASVWCFLEWLRAWLFTGFGWNSLGVAFHDTPVMAQSADLLGICGLSFLPVFMQVVLLQTSQRMLAEVRRGRFKPRIDFGVAAVMIALAFCYGVWRLHTVPGGEGIRFKVLLVQLNIPQEASRRLWTPEEIHFGYEEETLGALKQLEEEDLAKLQEGESVKVRVPDWIVWPESALYGRILRVGEEEWATWEQNLETLSLIQEAGSFNIALGLNEVEGEKLDQHYVEKQGGRLWNSLAVFDEEGELKTYRKDHLVIFGEYIPLVDKLPFLQAIYEQQAGASYGGAFARGGSYEPLAVEAAGEPVGLIPSVCFEDTVPRLMRRFVRQEPQWILNVTNDGWFKNSPAAAQHFANAKFRAIELRRPMVRCANTGVSAVVNPVGSTAHPDGGPVQELRDDNGNHLTRGWMLGEVVIPRDPVLSPYVLIGDMGVVVLGGLGFLVGVIVRKRQSRLLPS